MTDLIDNVIDLATAKPLASWTGNLARSKEGNVLPTVANILIILSNDPAVAGMVALNEFRAEYVITRAPPLCQDGDEPMPGPYPRQWTETDVTLVQAYMQRVWSPQINTQAVEAAMLTGAVMRRFHPVREYLAGLVWDGVPRLDTWLINAFACDDIPYHRAVASKTLIAAVRRIMKPGVKFDHMLVLEGQQGIGKSKCVRAMFVRDEWFSDAIPADLTGKDAAMSLSGVWCIEFAEIEHLIRAEVETIKAFLTRQTDRFRPPYAKAYVDRPRQCILIGTTNSEDYLRDVTGNRRIWPVRTAAADAYWIELNRDQLWAEAVQREAAGEATWLDDDAIRDVATEAQSERMTEDVWQRAIMEWVRGRPEVRVSDVLEHALSMSKEKMNKAADMRAGAVLRHLGWKRERRRIDGIITRVWLPPSAVPTCDDLGRDHLIEDAPF